MTFRRTKRAAHATQDWQRFLHSNHDALERTGVPLSIYESREMFEDLLMHGYIDHHEDLSHFAVRELSEEQRSLLVDVVVAFVRSFGDPGLAIFPHEVQEEIRRRVRLRPTSGWS
jgi:hypothetical protein